MTTAAFAAPISVGIVSDRGTSLTSARKSKDGGMKMSVVADVYISEAAVRDGKALANPYGTITKQCVEGTGKSNSAYSKRIATLSREFRLRQASTSEKYSDLYATRKEAISLSQGAHYAEESMVKFPISADRKVRAMREAALACDRYYKLSSTADEYMHQCVTRQYVSALTCSNGLYGRACADGAAKEEAETSRVASLAVQYAAGMTSSKAKAQQMYNSSKFATMVSRGCTYEEDQFIAFPKMAAAIRGLSTGAYAAVTSGAVNAGAVSTGQMGKAVSLEERLKGDNAMVLFPGSERRAAIPRKVAPWMTSPLRNYAPMSEAAVGYGKSFAENKYDDSQAYENKWQPGWVPTSSTQKYV